MAARTRAKYVLVTTDVFTVYATAVPLVSTDASDVAQATVEHWLLKFGTPNALRTDQGKVFGSKLCRLLTSDVTPTLPYKPEGRELTGRYNDKTIKLLCGEPKDVGYDVAVFEFCVQHDYSADDGSDAIQTGLSSGLPVSH